MTGTEIRQSVFQNIAHFGLRLAIGIIFITAGYTKFDAGFNAFLTQMGLPMELRYLFALEEFIPGIFLIIGILSRISAAVLCLVMLGVIFYVDKASQFLGPTGAEFPILLLAGSIIITITGPGHISVSRLLKKIPRFLQ